METRMSHEPGKEPTVPRALQFGTRSLFLATAGCALIALVFQRLGAVWGMGLVWFLVMAGAHVAANAFGTRQTAGAARHVPSSDMPRPQIDVAHCCAPATPLRDHRGFGRRLLIVTVSAAAAGLLLGTTALVLLTPANVPGVVLGGISASILAGFLGFVAGSFVMVATRSFREAVGDPCATPRPNTANSA